MNKIEVAREYLLAAMAGAHLLEEILDREDDGRSLDLQVRLITMALGQTLSLLDDLLQD